LVYTLQECCNVVKPGSINYFNAAIIVNDQSKIIVQL